MRTVVYGCALLFSEVKNLRYTKKTFVNKSQPPLNAAYFNGVEATLEWLCQRCAEKGTEGSGSNGTTYIVSITNVTSAPTGNDLPFVLQFTPAATNNAGCKVSIWGGSYPVYDISTGKAIGAGEMKGGVPADLIFDGSKFWYAGGGRYLKYGITKGTAGQWDTEFPITLPNTLSPALSNPIAYNGDLYASRVFQGVWNDYAEYRKTDTHIESGYVVVEAGDDTVRRSNDRLVAGAMVVSDTFGSVMGDWSQQSVPVCVAGRVLAYPGEPINAYSVGDPVCSGYNGTVSKMSREEVRDYPDRIIGTVSSIPNYEVWGSNEIPVKGRIWIKVR